MVLNISDERQKCHWYVQQLCVLPANFTAKIAKSLCCMPRRSKVWPTKNTLKEFVWSRSLFRAVRSLGFDSATKAMSELARGSDRLRLETSVVSLRLAIFCIGLLWLSGLLWFPYVSLLWFLLWFPLLATVHCSLSQKNIQTSSMNKSEWCAHCKRQ